MRALTVAFVLVTTMLIAPRALAQDGGAERDSTSKQATEDPAEERAAQFVGVRGPDAEQVPGGALLLAAYAVVWALLFVFLLRMRGLQRQTADELQRLSAEIRASGGR
ncbi:MAG: CcmD family protein [Myxococcales bacterium]|jgi:CcmD family protein|nr:CcmD family protein [Myxococcales bacterium]MDH3842436.1 CcmD family protein [Myxococcales bacterium]